jgi:hypothetical protein
MQDPSLECALTYGLQGQDPWTLVARTTSDQVPIVKTNPTVYPDEFWNQFRIIMVIRHPALTFPSFLRAGDKAFKDTIDSRMVREGNRYRDDRLAYDWFRKQEMQKTDSDDRFPVILDAYDLNAAETLHEFCNVMSLDPALVRYEWSEASEKLRETQGVRSAVFLSTIQDSTGIVKDKTPEHVNIEEEHQKWLSEWGEEIALKLRKQVDDAMEDYEYLRSKKMAVP